MNIKSHSKVYEKYKVIQQIGSGGFSTVYKVELLNDNSHPKKYYALKYCVRKGQNDYEINKKRFKEEIEVYKKINSEKVAQYIDSYVDEDEQFLVMEYVDGESLKDLLDQNGKMIDKHAVDYVTQIAEGISELHNNKIIHRDIKSNNIMVTKNTREIKIIDFGLALSPDSLRHTQEQKVVGSVYYMAPEICVSKSVPTEKSDIYALGILLFELLTATYPIKGKDPAETMKKQKNQPVPDVSKFVAVPQALSNIIIKATAKDPKKRYNTMWEMRQDLLTCLNTNRFLEKPLDLKKVKVKKTPSDIINKKGFTIGISIFIVCLLIIGVGLIVGLV